MTNIYLFDFVKDHEELYNKTNIHFKDKARKKCLWERFANSRKLSVKVRKTWFESQRTHYSKLTQSKSGQTPTEMTERQNWIHDKFNFLKTHIRHKGRSKSSVFRPKEPVHPLLQYTTSPEVQPTQIVWRSACDQTPQYSL